ncbi:MAG: hypothetical protein IJS38_04030 [Erysipelotrichaceae bacterium]|nr:hypothetical protein [Erysipelotrichaceae bacterium]
MKKKYLIILAVVIILGTVIVLFNNEKKKEDTVFKSSLIPTTCYLTVESVDGRKGLSKDLGPYSSLITTEISMDSNNHASRVFPESTLDNSFPGKAIKKLVHTVVSDPGPWKYKLIFSKLQSGKPSEADIQMVCYDGGLFSLSTVIHDEKGQARTVEEYYMSKSGNTLADYAEECLKQFGKQ